MDARHTMSGVIGGLVGGLVFGALMQMMGMMPMVAGLIGQESVGVGWVVHLVNSAIIGAIYGALVSPRAASWAAAAGAGVVYGVVWWVLGALFLMPLRLGMPPFQIGPMQLQSLMGHVIYGLITGLVAFAVVRQGKTTAVQAH